MNSRADFEIKQMELKNSFELLESELKQLHLYTNRDRFDLRVLKVMLECLLEHTNKLMPPSIEELLNGK